MRTSTTGLLAVLLAALAAAVLALAVPGVAKPPPTPPPPVDTGVVYAWIDDGVYSMKPDGTGRTALLSGCGYGEWEPSCATHGGERWFLECLPIEGEYWPDKETQRREIFAVSETRMVQITDGLLDNGGWVAPSHPSDNVRWANDGTTVDGKVSYVAKEYNADGDQVEAPYYRLYYVTFDPATLDDGVDLALTPTRINVPLTSGATINGHDWSPDGSTVVFRRRDDPGTTSDENGLWTATEDGTDWVLGDVLLYYQGVAPRWSRTGDTIVFYYAAAGILTVKPDGTSLTTIIAIPKDSSQRSTKYLYDPVWSPNAKNILYRYEVWGSGARDDVYRATASGEDQVNLTSGDGGYATPLGWRSE